MQQLTQITYTLFAIVIPVHSKGFAITNNVKGDYFLRYIDDVINLVDIEGDHKVIGTVSTTEIDFDPKQYVDKTMFGYKHYQNNTSHWVESKNSFRSLLSSKGITPTNETKVLILSKI